MLVFVKKILFIIFFSFLSSFIKSISSLTIYNFIDIFNKYENLITFSFDLGAWEWIGLTFHDQIVRKSKGWSAKINNMCLVENWEIEDLNQMGKNLGIKVTLSWFIVAQSTWNQVFEYHLRAPDFICFTGRKAVRVRICMHWLS